MIILDTADAMRAWSEDQRRAGKSIGLVPTMGALHEGTPANARGGGRTMWRSRVFS